jgi:16S rRNA (guanine527-N7)-methyltransferase
MSHAGFQRAVAARAAAARVVVTAAEIEKLETYFNLLVRWSVRMNLTALPLDGLPDKTLDRLFIEPLAAARYVPRSAVAWLDVGSGGGSPAVPLKVLRGQARLTMVESKARKAAFLREVVRTLELAGTDVQNVRFEEWSDSASPKPVLDLVTVRGVRADDDLLALCRLALRSDGDLLLFQSESVSGAAPAGFRRVKTVQLTETPAYLDVLKAV